MLIANPLYDVVFRKLMENERSARFFISTLIDEEIEKLEFDPGEFAYAAEPIGVRIFRLDFVCTVKLKSGERKKILIEIQKAHGAGDVVRFRKYLAEQYKKNDGTEEAREALPILTIYVLGFNLAEVAAPCVRVKRNYVDLITGETIAEKSPFIEKLTHDSYVIQAGRIKRAPKSRLEKLLSIFEQSGFFDGDKTLKNYGYEVDLEEIRAMLDILGHAGADPEERKRIEAEQEGWRVYELYYGEQNRKLADKEKSLEEKDKVIKEKDKSLQTKNKVIEEKDRLIKELRQKLNSD